MAYSILKLDFQSGLHVGDSLGGPSLDSSQMVIHGDTLFSAMYIELLKTGEEERLRHFFTSGELTISDALPFWKDRYYLPKPLLHVPPKSRVTSVRSKQLKALTFIAAADFSNYVSGLAGGTLEPDTWTVPTFGVLSAQTRVAIRGNDQPLPYSVGVWQFAPQCGLYIIVRYQEEESLALMIKALTWLGQSGIGGKTSSGLGRFRLMRVETPLYLLKLLEHDQAPYQMLLGVGLPSDDALEHTLAEGWYTLLRRGGFASSTSFQACPPRRKRTLYMLAAGSCLKMRFQGNMLDLSWEGAVHPVWRCSNTLFAGVDLS